MTVSCWPSPRTCVRLLLVIELLTNITSPESPNVSAKPGEAQISGHWGLGCSRAGKYGACRQRYRRANYAACTMRSKPSARLCPCALPGTAQTEHHKSIAPPRGLVGLIARQVYYGNRLLGIACHVASEHVF